jgi:hypothetical protein
MASIPSMAAMHEWSDAAGELLGAKAAVNARDSEGRLAIDYAERAQQRSM